MTDNEIKKALECCSKDNIDCEQCPANGLCDSDDYCFTGAILDLINRQKEEIERLKYLLDYEEKKYDLCAKRFFKEGVKEFAERLKSEIDIRPTYSREQNKYVFFLIDNLLKEMVGE